MLEGLQASYPAMVMSSERKGAISFIYFFNQRGENFLRCPPAMLPLTPVDQNCITGLCQRLIGERNKIVMFANMWRFDFLFVVVMTGEKLTE